jgi:hypothetical protein
MKGGIDQIRSVRRTPAMATLPPRNRHTRRPAPTVRTWRWSCCPASKARWASSRCTSR